MNYDNSAAPGIKKKNRALIFTTVVSALLLACMEAFWICFAQATRYHSGSDSILCTIAGLVALVAVLLWGVSLAVNMDLRKTGMLVFLLTIPLAAETMLWNPLLRRLIPSPYFEAAVGLCTALCLPLLLIVLHTGLHSEKKHLRLFLAFCAVTLLPPFFVLLIPASMLAHYVFIPYLLLGLTLLGSAILLPVRWWKRLLLVLAVLPLGAIIFFAFYPDWNPDFSMMAFSSAVPVFLFLSIAQFSRCFPDGECWPDCIAASVLPVEIMDIYGNALWSSDNMGTLTTAEKNAVMGNRLRHSVAAGNNEDLLVIPVRNAIALLRESTVDRRTLQAALDEVEAAISAYNLAMIERDVAVEQIANAEQQKARMLAETEEYRRELMLAAACYDIARTPEQDPDLQKKAVQAGNRVIFYLGTLEQLREKEQNHFIAVTDFTTALESLCRIYSSEATTITVRSIASGDYPADAVVALFTELRKFMEEISAQGCGGMELNLRREGLQRPVLRILCTIPDLQPEVLYARRSELTKQMDGLRTTVQAEHDDHGCYLIIELSGGAARA